MVNRRDRRFLIGFAASAAVAVVSVVFSYLETKMIEHLVLEQANNNALITPNGKGSYTINEYDRKRCSQYECGNTIGTRNQIARRYLQASGTGLQALTNRDDLGVWRWLLCECFLQDRR